jgi:hypothetical protein
MITVIKGEGKDKEGERRYPSRKGRISITKGKEG